MLEHILFYIPVNRVERCPYRLRCKIVLKWVSVKMLLKMCKNIFTFGIDVIEKTFSVKPKSCHGITAIPDLITSSSAKVVTMKTVYLRAEGIWHQRYQLLNMFWTKHWTYSQISHASLSWYQYQGFCWWPCSRAQHIRKFSLAQLQKFHISFNTDYIYGLVYDCTISIANALEIL